MGIQENKEKVKQVFQGYATKDLSIFKEIIHPNGFFRIFENGENKENFDVVKLISDGNELLQIVDITHDIEYIIGEVNRVICLGEKTITYIKDD
ncbi:MAG: hypothetical protein ACXAC2_24620, partial [Candidatus Kariarchaeaceae archaeon]